MSENLWNEVDEYINQKLVNDPLMEQVLKTSVAEGLPAINVSPAQGKLLMQLVRMTSARSILEIGTLGAYSTIWMARGLPPQGRVLTLEVEPHYATVARKNIAHANLAEVIEVREGKALELLPKIDSKFDFVFIDADKINNSAYVEWALKLSSPGTVIIVDNVVRNGDVINDRSDNPGVIGTRKVFDLMSTHPRLEATAIQTVGQKGYDGFAMAVVKE